MRVTELWKVDEIISHSFQDHLSKLNKLEILNIIPLTYQITWRSHLSVFKLMWVTELWSSRWDHVPLEVTWKISSCRLNFWSIEWQIAMRQLAAATKQDHCGPVYQPFSTGAWYNGPRILLVKPAWFAHNRKGVGNTKGVHTCESQELLAQKGVFSNK